MNISYSLSEIAARLGGEVLGDEGVRIVQVATLETAGPDQISFLSNSKYRALLSTTRAGAVIVADEEVGAVSIPRIVTKNPYAYFAQVSALLNPLPESVAGIHPTAVIGVGASIDATTSVGAHVVVGAGVTIGSHCVIGEGCSIGKDVVLGDHTRLYPSVTVYHSCIVGSHVIVHSGAVIGADGFGFAMEAGKWLKIQQIGRVVIGDHVEIGANTTIDRGALDDTVIEEGVKLDNQIQVAHNVRIGAHTVISGCVGIAGSAVIGKHCRIGGSAGILGHLRIADDVEIAPFTLIGKSITESGRYAGIYPFTRNDEWRVNAVHLRHLGDLVKRVKTLEKEIESLKGEKK
ncbi:MAG: UDP-3-O-(3-hydroxymyristoyl)glucosamine N-acyltransferase [Gallionella sp.]